MRERRLGLFCVAVGCGCGCGSGSRMEWESIWAANGHDSSLRSAACCSDCPGSVPTPFPVIPSVLPSHPLQAAPTAQRQSPSSLSSLRPNQSLDAVRHWQEALQISALLTRPPHASALHRTSGRRGTGKWEILEPTLSADPNADAPKRTVNGTGRASARQAGPGYALWSLDAWSEIAAAQRERAREIEEQPGFRCGNVDAVLRSNGVHGTMPLERDR